MKRRPVHHNLRAGLGVLLMLAAFLTRMWPWGRPGFFLWLAGTAVGLWLVFSKPKSRE